MTRFRKHFEDFVFQIGVPCVRYIPHYGYNRYCVVCENHRPDVVRKKNKRKEGVTDE